MGESRQELLAWINELLDLNITKVEMLGKGSVYCQIIDSIFFDVAMQKVKFDVNSEYQYIQNFKVLQASFLKHRVDKEIPVERLVKCKFQDNLEFLQWIKKYWDQYYTGAAYDPNARRKGINILNNNINNNNNIQSQQVSARALSSGSNYSRGNTVYPKPTNSAGNSTRAKSRDSYSNTNSTRVNSSNYRNQQTLGRSSLISSSANNSSISINNNTNNNTNSQALVEAKNQISNLESEIESIKDQSLTLERERDFYYGKLREIELLVQDLIDFQQKSPELRKEAMDNNNFLERVTENQTIGLPVGAQEIVTTIQNMLYSTEEGFENPSDNVDQLDNPLVDEELASAVDSIVIQEPLIDTETF